MGARRTITWAMLCTGAGLAAAITAVAQEVPAGMVRAVPDRPTRVLIMAAFDDNCKPLPAPAISITTPPKKGVLQFREGQATTVQFSSSGKCIGTPVTGTGIYYSARADSSGEDTFTISARSATGETSTRTVRMFISDGI